jgi:hypothetical protein
MEMSFDKWRFVAEITGIVALVASLIFVGLQLRQDRHIALAGLAQTRNEMLASRWTAGLQSEASLSTWTKLYSRHDWNADTLTEQEIAAAEIDAMIWWTYLEVTFRHHRLGLVDDDEWAAWEANVVLGDRLSPVYRAVFERFWHSTPSDYTHAVDEILTGTRGLSSQASDANDRATQ